MLDAASGSLKCLPLTNKTPKIQNYWENPKWCPALLKIVKFACALPCGHPGPEGCCTPSMKGMQWLPLM